MKLPDGEHFGTLLIEVPHSLEMNEHTVEAMAAIPVATWVLPQAHLYLWMKHSYLQSGLELIRLWGFTYKTNLIWTREALIQQAEARDTPDDDEFFRVCECILFGVRGKLRTFAPGRRQTNSIRDDRTEELATFPPELYTIIGQCSPAPFLEVSSRPTLIAGWHSVSHEEGMHEIGELR